MARVACEKGKCGRTVDLATVLRIGLRLLHTAAAVVWLGGGVYYVLALRPLRSHGVDAAPAVIAAAQRRFGRWASAATLLLLATGVPLMFDRLADGRGTAAYVLLLALKVGAAVAAFWLAWPLARRRTNRFGDARPWLIVALGSLAYLLGVVLATLYPVLQR